MNCWICGKPANSGEHKAKASDIRSVLGTPTNKIPFHLRIGDEKFKLQGINVDLIKWGHMICQSCNNSLSSPYDRAWQKLSDFLQKYPNGLPSINLKYVFGKNFINEYLYLYLYFVKQFGCYISTANVGIDLTDFSNSVLNQNSNRNFYIRLSYFKNWPIQRMIALTPLNLLIDGSNPVIAIAGYSIGPWCIDMTYWDSTKVAPPPIIKSSMQPPIKHLQIPVFVTQSE